MLTHGQKLKPHQTLNNLLQATYVHGWKVSHISSPQMKSGCDVHDPTCQTNVLYVEHLYDRLILCVFTICG